MHRFVWREVDESHALFKVVIDYTYALDTLDDYDYKRLSINQHKTAMEEHRRCGWIRLYAPCLAGKKQPERAP